MRIGQPCVISGGASGGTSLSSTSTRPLMSRIAVLLMLLSHSYIFEGQELEFYVPKLVAVKSSKLQARLCAVACFLFFMSYVLEMGSMTMCFRVFSV